MSNEEPVIDWLMTRAEDLAIEVRTHVDAGRETLYGRWCVYAGQLYVINHVYALERSPNGGFKAYGVRIKKNGQRGVRGYYLNVTRKGLQQGAALREYERWLREFGRHATSRSPEPTST